MRFALLISRYWFLVGIVHFRVLTVNLDHALIKGGSVCFSFFECDLTEFLQSREGLLFGAGIDLHAEFEVLSQVQIALVLGLGGDLALLELLVNLHSNIGGEESTAHTIGQLRKKLLVHGLTGSLATRVCDFCDVLFIVFILAKLLREVNCYDVESDVSFAHLTDHFLLTCVRGSLTICDQENPLLYLPRATMCLQHLEGHGESVNKVTALLLDLRAVMCDLVKVAEEFKVDLAKSPFGCNKVAFILILIVDVVCGLVRIEHHQAKFVTWCVQQLLFT